MQDGTNYNHGQTDGLSFDCTVSLVRLVDLLPILILQLVENFTFTSLLSLCTKQIQHSTMISEEFIECFVNMNNQILYGYVFDDLTTVSSHVCQESVNELLLFY